MDVKQSFDEQHVAWPRYLLQNPRQPVRWEIRPVAAAEVQVADVGPGFEGPRPERLDPPALVAPPSAETTRPAGVGKDARLLNLGFRVARRPEAVARGTRRGNDTEPAPFDCL